MPSRAQDDSVLERFGGNAVVRDCVARAGVHLVDRSDRHHTVGEFGEVAPTETGELAQDAQQFDPVLVFRLGDTVVSLHQDVRLNEDRRAG